MLVDYYFWIDLKNFHINYDIWTMIKSWEGPFEQLLGYLRINFTKYPLLKIINFVIIIIIKVMKIS